MADIFRQSQLDKLSSPDQIDKAVEITPPSFWIAVIGGAFIIVVAFIWSICGTMPQKVETNGMYILDNKGYTLSSEVNGIVEDVYVKVGDSVDVGDILYTLNTASLEKEKAELEERRDIVDAVTLTSKGDVSNNDTQPLLEIKNQIDNAGSQVSQNETMLALREKELEEQKVITEKANDRLTEARHKLEEYQNKHSNVEEHYNYVKDAWGSVIQYKAAMDASQNVMQETKDDLDYYSYYAGSTDPDEAAQYEAAYNTYTSAYQTYYSNKTQYETAMYSYNDLLNTYFPDAQPSVAPDKQVPDLVTYVNAYKSEIANLQQEYDLAQNEYSNEYSRESSLESEISSLNVQIAAGMNGEGTSIEGYTKQFDATKEMTINSINDEIRRYEEKIGNNTVKSTVSGYVGDVNILAGAAVGEGSATIAIRKIKDDYDSQGDYVVCYVDWASAKKVTPGMDVKVYPTTADRQEYGNMIATVDHVDNFASSENHIMDTIGSESIAQMFLSNGPVICIKCRLEPDPSSASGYKWSSKKGSKLVVPYGTLVSADIITEYKKPITMLIPYLKGKFNSKMEKEESDDN